MLLHAGFFFYDAYKYKKKTAETIASVYLFYDRVPAYVDIHMGHVCICTPSRCVNVYEKAAFLQNKIISVD